MKLTKDTSVDFNCYRLGFGEHTPDFEDCEKTDTASSLGLSRFSVEDNAFVFVRFCILLQLGLDPTFNEILTHTY